ncbi:lantibiotic dehydratase [Microscilla marina]|uniref:Lantibiotic dehydratase, C terminus family n=1 Tax=Microscilla marina ATCC 23134 TaxID=313606 RepID=A1ZIL1_MICM2|nr:lantibiotic dehydratase [Microscilla marina]EAY29879.1 lantibiotic dehydratase, C terminus family [Microscilla marina ATCC 23134]
MNTFEPGNFYVLRTPLLERSYLKPPVGVAQGIEQVRQHLQAMYALPALQQALYIASPNLFAQLDRWHTLVALPAPNKKQSKDLQNLEQKLWMFLARAAYRCTPFGTFAAVTAGEFRLQRHSSLALDGLGPMRTSSRLDMVYLLRLRAALEADTEVREQLLYFPNNTLYCNGDDMLCSFFDEQTLQHVASSKEFNEVAWELFATCRQAGGMRIQEMIAHLMTDPDLTEADCYEFVEYLINHHLLISELYPSLNGAEYLEQLHTRVKQIPAAQEYLDIIEHIRRQLALIDATPDPAQSLGLYQQLAGYLSAQPFYQAQETAITAHPNEKTASKKELIQVDAFRDENGQALSKTVPRHLVRQIATLIDNVGEVPTTKADLTSFAQAFFKRYENEAVPLLLAMDEVTGVGYPCGKRVAALPTYLQELGVVIGEGGAMPQVADPKTGQTSALDSLLEQKYVEALQKGLTEIRLSKVEIQGLKASKPKAKEKQAPPLPPAMMAMGKLLYQTPDDLEHNPKQGNPRNFRFQLYHASGPVVGNLLGRFCYGSPLLKEKLSATLAQVEPDNDHLVYAEVDHLPGQRVGNVIIRPRLRDYSIALGGANTNDAHQIPVTDLWLSTQEGGKRLVLHSRRLGKQVVPRMSNAHNYAHNAHPLYKFLCDLQYQEEYRQLPPFFKVQRWQQRSYLPRLVYDDNLILSPRQWRVSRQLLEAVQLQKKEDLHTTISTWTYKIERLRQQLRLPQTVLLVEADNKLYIDFANPLSVGVFLQKVFVGKEVVLEEVIEEHVPSQSYSNELIFPITNTVPPIHKQTQGLAAQTLPQSIQKNFALGSEWVYFKIYLGALGSDRLIVEDLYPLSKELKDSEHIDQWFFIRYTDPDYGPHLRWRLHLCHHPKELGEVVQVFSQKLLALKQQGKIIHYVPDTYQRELNRYLPYNIALSEKWFALDSDFVGHILELLAQDETATDALKSALAIKRIKALLDAFDLPKETREKIIHQGRVNFSREFGFDTHPQAQRLKKALAKHTLPPWLPPAYRLLFDQLTEQEVPLAQQIKANLQQHGANEAQLCSLLSSYIHMFNNRLFVGGQRLEEMWGYWKLEG